MGTSGGLGLPPGSIVVSSEALDGLLRPQYRQIILGKVQHWPGQFDENVSNMLGMFFSPLFLPFGNVHAVLGHLHRSIWPLSLHV